MNKKKFTKLLALYLPYLVIGLAATNLGESWRLAEGKELGDKIVSLIDTLPAAFANPLPSLHPLDILVGICCGAGLRLAVYLKSKNAKKYRHGMEYGSARWGTPADIAPFMAPKFEDNIILTKTERLMMSNRPPDPKNARNKNVLVVGGSGSGKTRYFIKPNLLQCTSKSHPVSFVVTDPKGGLIQECGLALLKNGYKIRTMNTINFHKSISMIYSQLFNLLCDKADDVYGGKLPVHVRCLIDECANIGQIPQLEKLVATIRSREISACLVLQTRSQLKAIYKDNADTIVGNMDSQIFLGGSEPTTLKDLAEALGKETIDSYNNSDTRGNSPSYGTNYQKLGHELMSRDELAVLDGGKCILQLRGVRPFLSDKYDLTQHPNYKLTSDANPKNALDIEKYLSHKEKIHSDDQFVLVDVDSLPPA